LEKREQGKKGKTEPQELSEFYSSEYINDLIIKALHSSEQAEKPILDVQPHGEETFDWNEEKKELEEVLEELEELEELEVYRQPIFVVETLNITESWPQESEKKEAVPQKEEERWPSFQQFEKKEEHKAKEEERMPSFQQFEKKEEFKEEERMPSFQQFEKEEKHGEKEEGVLFENEKVWEEKREHLENKDVLLPESPKFQKQQWGSSSQLGKLSISDIISQATEEVGPPS